MTESNSGVQATPAADMLSQDNPITAECFLPPRFSCPRAWQRVAVAPVPGMRRQSRIWKRVGGLTVGTGQSPYIRAMAELERQGMGPRKRARHAHHLQAWGDAKWDPRAEERPDGHQDIVEAQGMVSDAAHKPTTTTNNTKTKPATYPEESLKWVPRKRHNSRWPLAPKSEAGSPTTHLQHSTESERLVSTEPVEATAKVDEEQMSKRSTRRLSRRISLFPGDESPRRLSTIALSPAGSSAPAASPVKRSSVALSPTKVADSPLRSFRVNATPTKVVLESPKVSPPEKSPAKLQAPLTPDTRPSSPPASPPASPAPLMFDQPVPDAQAEPQHEVRRRLSLQSARRSERGSNGALRLLALKRGTDNLNRRHSLTTIPAIAVGDGVRGESKSRRKTMDVFSSGLEATGGNAEDARTTGATPDHHRAEDVVEIDMKTRLDIFGQPPVTAAANPPLLSSDGQSPLTSGELGVAEKVEVEAEAEQATPCCQAATTSMAAETNEVPALTRETSPRLAESASVEGGSESDAVRLPDANELPCAAHEVSSDEGSPAPDDDLQEATQNLAVETNPHACVEMEHLSEQEMIEAQFTNGGSPVANVEQSESTTNADSSASSPASPRLRSDTPNLGAKATDAVQDEQPVVAASVTESHVCSGNVVSAANGTAVGTELPQHSTENTATDDLDENARATDDQAANPPKDCGVNPCPTGIANIQLPESSSGTDRSTPPSPGTPCSTPTARSTEPMEGVSNPQNQGDGLSPSGESSGFTPINKRRVPPPSDLPTGLRDDEEPAADHESDELDADEVVEEDVPQEEGDEDIVAMDEDMTVEAPKPECDTLQLHARQDDSETEMLRNFVTRVAAGKSAKAAAAAAALAKKIARRSSSLGSISSSTGSPVGRAGLETPGSRQPLGVRSPNSASPAKKRKADAFEDDLAKEDSSAEPCAEPTDGPRLKKRRKYPESILKTAPEPAAPSSEANSAPPSNITTSLLSPKSGPRRSTRARSTRVALKPSAPSANSIAFSMIPVRLPGMGAMDEPAMASDAHLSAARQRSEEKDLAAVTRANTRKNKGGAVPPPVVLAKQAEDPAGWRMRELKGVWEAKERRKGAALSEKGPEAEEEGGGKGKKGKKVKEVRWAEELVRYQPYEEGGGMFSGMARALLADVMADDGVDEIAEAEPPALAEPAVEKTARVAARKAGSGRKSSTTGEAAPAPPAAPASTRRTRSSKLPPPTPVKKLRGAGKPAAEKSPPAEKTEPAEKPAATPSLRTRARSLPKRAAAPAPATAPATVDPSPATASSSTRTGMATRRTRVTKLGMSGNGTPAPKRRGKAAA
ncbi:hypothetical protein MYCTH_2308011 [Thermothelomyces thermophilus ATCC 42464]|uniref:Uncharacterized protein n=1 Tax=Thermothelomyces thermophilus (strain ATCC 42464 / BCRC 31852 / DSM 1799) TaxID=573729 RepID=G2QIW6_THET4|nr:uncharacterized protein MYCTH_2308011 [Thermothelomyces thermophilus ATCC 42464]AEO59594.1 hypothetical protein MYCTH_2308011 [Thermothelomyces thermophilus ATCC 42464]